MKEEEEKNKQVKIDIILVNTTRYEIKNKIPNDFKMDKNCLLARE